MSDDIFDNAVRYLQDEGWEDEAMAVDAAAKELDRLRKIAACFDEGDAEIIQDIIKWHIPESDCIAMAVSRRLHRAAKMAEDGA